MTELEFFQTMQRAMDTQAEEIWDMVHHSRTEGYRLRLGEVTATELNFFRLRDFWTKRVYVVTNEPDETVTGADWEWLIGHGDSWIQIRVQAKIMNRSGRFAELGHPHSTGQQMERLVNPNIEDVTCRWMPLYVFYTAEPGAGTVVPRKAGCSAQLASKVRTTYGKPPANRARLTSAAHLPESIPWSSVFDGLVTQLQSGRSLAEIIEKLALRPMPADAAYIGDFWDMSKTAGTCDRALPTYVREIVRRENDEFDEAPLTRLEVTATTSHGSERPDKGPFTNVAPRQVDTPRRPSEDDSGSAQSSVVTRG
ncbi:DUF6615 family protein [Subtercola boreus]|uniref:DUF6615 family protein n=1 Tax=Subtercola boreus TaxID=120213 RepID=UPI0011C06085|nr:DUF6615 family protein [Subtercola boreus]